MIGTLQAEIDRALLAGDVDEVTAMLQRLGMRPSSRAAAEVAMHKARTGRLTLPKDVRDFSRQWLIARGFTPWGQ